MKRVFSAAFLLASPAGPRAGLSSLIFHRVLPEPDLLFPTEVDSRQFDAIMGWVKQWFNVLPLHEAVERLKHGNLPAAAAAITFDDGYADNYDIALPILRRHGLTATFFIATGFLDGGRMFNDTVIEAIRSAPPAQIDLTAIGLGRHTVDTIAARRATINALLPQIKYQDSAQRAETVAAVAEACGVELPTVLMMTTPQLRALHAAGMGIGAHTVNHPILARLDTVNAHREIAESKAHLEAVLGEPIRLFAYPNGKPGDDYLPEHAAMVKKLGFDAAVSTAWGAARVETDRYQLPRFTPWERQKWRFGLSLLRNYGRNFRQTP